MRVRPANPGMMIRDPRTRRPLADDGGRVADSNFWRRRIADGDVVLVDDDDGNDVEPGELEARQVDAGQVEGAPVGPEHADVPPLATRERPGFFSRLKGEETR